MVVDSLPHRLALATVDNVGDLTALARRGVRCLTPVSRSRNPPRPGCDPAGVIVGPISFLPFRSSISYPCSARRSLAAGLDAWAVIVNYQNIPHILRDLQYHVIPPTIFRAYFNLHFSVSSFKFALLRYLHTFISVCFLLVTSPLRNTIPRDFRS